MDFESEIPWPSQQDSIFASVTDWWNDAVIESSAGDWYAYILGYKRAADLAVEHVASTGTYQELLVFPIIFLYRHYLELQMKRLIWEGRSLLDEELLFPYSHDLKKLWSDCRRIIEKIFPESKDGDTANVERILYEIHDIDPTSMSFRYPTNRDLSVSIPANLRRLNLRVLADVMSKLQTFFDGASTGISVYLDNKRDMEASMY